MVSPLSRVNTILDSVAAPLDERCFKDDGYDTPPGGLRSS